MNIMPVRFEPCTKKGRFEYLFLDGYWSSKILEKNKVPHIYQYSAGFIYYGFNKKLEYAQLKSSTYDKFQQAKRYEQYKLMELL